jgi:hypothetical protein
MTRTNLHKYLLDLTKSKSKSIFRMKPFSQSRMNVLSTFIDASNAHNIFYSDYYSQSNKLYNRMKFLSLPEINIININRNPIDEKNRYFSLPVIYSRSEDWVYKKEE